MGAVFFKKNVAPRAAQAKILRLAKTQTLTRKTYGKENYTNNIRRANRRRRNLAARRIFYIQVIRA